MKPPQGVQSVTIVQVICIEEAVGNGKDDPIRPVYSYWTMTGELICRNDPLQRASEGKKGEGG